MVIPTNRALSQAEIYTTLNLEWKLFMEKTEFRDLTWDISLSTHKVILHATSPGSTILQIVSSQRRIVITILVRGADIKVFQYAGRFFAAQLNSAEKGKQIS